MKGFLLDENVPRRLQFEPSAPVIHSRDIGERLSDAALWDYARIHELVLVTKDADFAERILSSDPPPRVVHLRIGNLRRAEFHLFLKRVWPRVEVLLKSSKLVNVYLTSLESVS